MTLAETIDALRPLQVPHATAHGERRGFLMRDAVRALGSLSQASNSLALLMAVDLVVSAPLVIGDEVQTVFSLADSEPLTIH